ncbi:hypothetical protein HGQ17_13925 [Nesterenkonia sp. MY13]|uniref:Uncharacterized protein n=1 Tax=Nesterenkonia sedimenti TaxID=1463632 RepID=A0A7X8TLU6_9MICC|nr:hypothetical protein [Nesterenkonia sedimenti]NLS11073.1 hypothetical protein [Nesterenkonia sedimenti]
MTTSPMDTDYEEFVPFTDPVNQLPKGDKGYPARLHTKGGVIWYYDTRLDRDVAVKADQYRLELWERMNAPWWKRLWWRMKPEF